MAFEQLDKFTQEMKAAFDKTNKPEYLYVLTSYYETVCSHAKFRSQKAYCRRIIFEMNPAYAKGYFKADK
ncbi:MAG: hypothetical protein U0T77_10615 [Chitinophagales bacterium]